MDNILLLGAHYDDIEIGMGGTLLKYVNKHKIFFCITSSDEYRTSNPEIRHQEQLNALHYFSKKKISFFPFLEEISQNNIIKELDKYKFQRIYTHYDDDTHYAHNRCSQIGKALARKKDTELFYYNSGSAINFNPNCFSIIDFSKKIELLRYHKSQIKHGALNFNKIKKQNAYYGSLASNKKTCYAEGFVIQKIIFD